MVVSESQRKAAEAQGLANGARSLEEQAAGLQSVNPEQARYLFAKARQAYLDVAQAYQDAVKAGGTEQEKNNWTHSLNLYVKKARALAPQPPPRIAVRQGGGSETIDDAFEIKPEKSDITFAQVAGLDSVKEQIRLSIIQPMKSPALYQRLGLKAGGGILLYGPPGCGKTFIGKAAAGECKANFYNVKINDILSKYVGESEQHFNAVVESATKNAPSIIFLDEIDALAVSRDSADSSHTTRLVNQILSSMDGFASQADKPIFWMATTNRPWIVDPAIRRPGRLDKTAFVPLPDRAARRKILELNTKAELVRLGPQDYDLLADSTDGYTSADLVFLTKEAKQIILKEVTAEGKPERPAVLNDFQIAVSQTKSSLLPWLNKAKAELVKSGEISEYPDLIALIKKYSQAN